MKRESNIFNKIIKLNNIYKILLVICYLLISIFVVFMISNRFNFKYHVFNEISVLNKYNKIENEDTNIYEIEYESVYAKRIFIKYSSNSNFNMGITYKLVDNNTDVYSIDKVEECSYLIDSNVINSKVLSNYISITVPKDVVINDVVINNKLTFNYAYLFIFVIILLAFIGFLIVYHYGISKLHVLFIIMYISLGMFMIFNSCAMSGSSWDDQIHFDCTNKAIRFDDYNMSEAEIINRDLVSPFHYFNNIEEQNLINNKLNELDNNKKFAYNTNVVSYTSIAYLPGSILYNIMKYIGINFTTRFMLVKMFGIIVYALIIGYAIKLISKYKLLLFVLGLIPTGLFIASNYNYDAVIYSFTLLAFATFIKMMNDSKVSNKDLMIYVISISIAALTKFVYAPLLLLLLIIPNEKFKSIKNAKNFKRLLILITLLVSFAFIINTIFVNIGFDDTRGGTNVSVVGQIKYILHNPITFSKMFVFEIFQDLARDFMSQDSFLSFAYRGDILNENVLFMMYLIFGLAFAYSCNDKNDIKLKNRIVVFIVCVLIICMTWGVLYLSFNDVGKMAIDGVQPRYFMPVLPFVLYLFINNKISFKIDEYKIVGLIVVLYLMVYIHSMYIAYLMLI